MYSWRFALPAVSARSGEALPPAYGWTDLDGSRPDIRRFIAEVREAGCDADCRDYRQSEPQASNGIVGVPGSQFDEPDRRAPEGGPA